MKKFLCVAVGVFSLQVQAGCFKDHLREAAAINSERKPIYAELAGTDSGRSLKVSDLLIASENLLALFKAPRFDRRAERLEKDIGFNVTCLSFVPMDHIGEMTDLPRPISQRNMIEIDSSKWQKELEAMGRKRPTEQLPVLIHALKQRKKILNFPEYNCMVRHILESAIRIAQVAHRHSELMASHPGFNDLLWDLIELQLSGISGGHILDSLAGPLQKQGIPIICNDVPPIDEY